MKIENLEYIDKDSNIERHGLNLSPLTGETITTPSDQLRKSGALDVQWTEVSNFGKQQKIRLNKGNVSNAALSDDRRFLLVSFDDKNWPFPWPIAVFNSDGSLRGKIKTPPVIKNESGQSFFSEGANGIGITQKNNTSLIKPEKKRVLFVDCYYDFDRIAKVELIPENMQWGRVLKIGGRA